MVTKLDRVARSLRDERAIADGLTARQVHLRLGASMLRPRSAAVQETARTRLAPESREPRTAVSASAWTSSRSRATDTS